VLHTLVGFSKLSRRQGDGALTRSSVRLLAVDDDRPQCPHATEGVSLPRTLRSRVNLVKQNSPRCAQNRAELAISNQSRQKQHSHWTCNRFLERTRALDMDFFALLRIQNERGVVPTSTCLCLTNSLLSFSDNHGTTDRMTLHFWGMEWRY
jgi:hypothetical protein